MKYIRSSSFLIQELYAFDTVKISRRVAKEAKIAKLAEYSLRTLSNFATSREVRYFLAKALK